MSECAGAAPPASPMPTPMRASASSSVLRAKPETAVKALQIAKHDRQDRAARGAVGQASDRQARRRVEHREGRAGQEPHHRVRRAELLLDRLQQHREDVAVEVVERVHREEREEHVAGVGARRLHAAPV